ncbi:peroxiredoxin-like family protein [Sabulicella rubraurantiaca]|uniref:peroxiredoxin-like family protein n=1 Tax=Sabulicella rubraurantiaca TaxID=2811429 RepID=UPI001A96FFE9|nr:peroxiredoxin-like family protein [Sabulicella rubraurantiaca]
MTLEERLAKERRKRAGNAPLQAAIRDVVGHLRRGGDLDHALPVGDEFPNFMLPDAEGRLVTRDALLACGPLVLGFFRGGWCPYCAATLDALQRAMPQFEAAGATLAAVTPETGGLALDLKRRHKAGFTMLVDVDSGLAATCGLLYRVPDSYLTILAGVGVDLGVRQGNGGLVLPVPATFVVAPGGRVAWRQLDPDFTRRADPADILRAVEAL